MTPREAEILDDLHDWFADRVHSPSYVEMGERVGMSAVAVRGIVARMARKGLVTVERGQARSIRIAPPRAAIADVPTAVIEVELKRRGLRVIGLRTIGQGERHG